MKLSAFELITPVTVMLLHGWGEGGGTTLSLPWRNIVSELLVVTVRMP